MRTIALAASYAVSSVYCQYSHEFFGEFGDVVDPGAKWGAPCPHILYRTAPAECFMARFIKYGTSTFSDLMTKALEDGVNPFTGGDPLPDVTKLLVDMVQVDGERYYNERVTPFQQKMVIDGAMFADFFDPKLPEVYPVTSRLLGMIDHPPVPFQTLFPPCLAAQAKANGGRTCRDIYLGRDETETLYRVVMIMGNAANHPIAVNTIPASVVEIVDTVLAKLCPANKDLNCLETSFLEIISTLACKTSECESAANTDECSEDISKICGSAYPLLQSLRRRIDPTGPVAITCIYPC